MCFWRCKRFSTFKLQLRISLFFFPGSLAAYMKYEVLPPYFQTWRRVGFFKVVRTIPKAEPTNFMDWNKYLVHKYPSQQKDKVIEMGWSKLFHRHLEVSPVTSPQETVASPSTLLALQEHDAMLDAPWSQENLRRTWPWLYTWQRYNVHK